MRPWIALKAAGIAFDETVIPLYAEGSKEKIRAHSPAGKVPVLIDGETHARVGIARDPRIPGGEISRRAAVAVRSGGAGACARDLDRDACGLCGAAPANAA